MKITGTVEPWDAADADQMDGFAVARIKMRRARWFGYARRRFDLISFADMADWCAREPGSFDRNEARRAQVIGDLRDAVLRGEFGPENRLMVACLPKAVPIGQCGQFFLRLRIGHFAGMLAWSHDLTDDLWAPRPLCAQWFVARGTAPPPWLSAPPASPAPVPVAVAAPLSIKATYSDDALRAWFALRVHTWPISAPKPSEADDLTAAKAAFDDVPRDVFREIRRDKVPAEWRKPGPRTRR